MATWASSMDVLEDLDRLSEFSAGTNCTQNFDIVSQTSYGRGEVRNEETPRDVAPGRKSLRRRDDREFYCVPRLSPGIGRGERMKAYSQRRKEESLQRQLRMAMGIGYSNELIEDFIRRDSSSNPSSEADQVESCDDISESKVTLDVEEKGSYSPLLEEPRFEKKVAVTPEPPVTVEGTSSTMQVQTPRRCRNALLNSLSNLNRSTEMAQAHSTVDKDTDTCDPVKESQKQRASNSLPNPDEFQFKEDDFPPL